MQAESIEWRVNFPVVCDPLSRKMHLVLWSKPIDDARPGFKPSMVAIIGLGEDGTHRKFMVPLASFAEACRAPVHLVSRGHSSTSPTGTVPLVSAHGQVLDFQRG